jgi:hypothetical protein
LQKRFVYNQYNQAKRPNRYFDNNSTFTYSTYAYTIFPNAGGARVEFVEGMADKYYDLNIGMSVEPSVSMAVAVSSGSSGGFGRFALNGDIQYNYEAIGASRMTGNIHSYANTTIAIPLGYNYIDGMVIPSGAGVTMWFYTFEIVLNAER